MPRYFGNETYNGDQGAVKWYNGACAVDEGDAAAIAFLSAITGITEDTNKHELTVLDKLTREQIDGISSYLGVPLVSTDTKAQVIRKIEGTISTEFLGTLTVTSAAGTEPGDTLITITEAVGAGNTYYYKCAAAAPNPLYGDQVDSTWKTIVTLNDITPPEGGAHITVVRAVTSTGFILASGTAAITTNNES